MEGNKRVYSKPDLTVMYYTPSDVAATGCTYTTSTSNPCLIGGQTSEGVESSYTYYIGYYNSVQYIIWYAQTNDPPLDGAIDTYAPYIKGVYNYATGDTWSSDNTQNWHIAQYDSSGWSGNAS